MTLARRLRPAARRHLARFFASVESAAAGAVDSVVAGRALLTAAGFAVVAFAPFLSPTREAWFALAVVSACMTVALAVSYVIAWDRLPGWSTVSFPFLVCSALAVLGLTAHGFSAPLTGVLTLCFTFVGLTQRPGTALYGLPV